MHFLTSFIFQNGLVIFYSVHWFCQLRMKQSWPVRINLKSLNKLNQLRNIIHEGTHLINPKVRQKKKKRNLLYLNSHQMAFKSKTMRYQTRYSSAVLSLSKSHWPFHSTENWSFVFLLSDYTVASLNSICV